MTLGQFWAVVPAAGVGRRMGTTIPKQYLTLAGHTVLEHTLWALLHHRRIAGVAVAVGTEDAYWPTLTLPPAKPVLRAPGGLERAHSVLNALETLADRLLPDDWVLVHDAVRPCLHPDDLDRLLTTLADDPVGGLLAVPARDTLKRADAAGRVVATLDRSLIWQAQTPQMFRYGLLREALARALADGLTITDEASAIEALGLSPQLVPGRADNLKITCPEDLALAAFHLSQRKLS